MERTPGSNPNRLQRFDAVPRDGPAVFIVNRAAFDRGEIVGDWIAVTSDADEMAAAVDDLIGGSTTDGWVIIDQVGLGDTMADEDASLTQLATTYS